MEQWNQIIQTALIGTEKMPLQPQDFGDDLSSILMAIQQNVTLDKEEQFLQSSAIAFNYMQCGKLPLQKAGIEITVAETEEKPYCNLAAKQVLADILMEDSPSLLSLWLQNCERNGQLIHPEMLPLLMDKAIQQKKLQPLVESCSGKRGKWLSQFNPDWHFVVDMDKEETWQTGIPEARKKVLKELRVEAPSKAREWLQNTWHQENVASKLSLLETLETNLSAADMEWLESLTQEKNQKVKDEVLRLLKKIPESSVVQQYCAVIAQAVFIKKEKTIFGLSSKQSLQIALPDGIDDLIFKTGIEKLSNQKVFTDESFIIYQLLQHIPPSFLEKHLQLNPKEIIELFQKENATKKFFPAIVIAIVHFMDKRWAIAVMQHSAVFYLDIIPLIPMQQQLYYSQKHFAGNEAFFIQHATNWTEEWTVDFTRMVLTYMAANPYQFNKRFYNHQIQFLPTATMDILDAVTPEEAYAKSSWATTKDYINKLLSLKQKISTSFP